MKASSYLNLSTLNSCYASQDFTSPSLVLASGGCINTQQPKQRQGHKATHIPHNFKGLASPQGAGLVVEGLE